MLGLVIARLSRRSAHPQALFMRITLALNALSLIPDVVTSFDTASRIMLVMTHIAAAVVVPVLARRLPTAR